MRSPALSKFFEALTAQEVKIQEAFKHDNIGWMLKAAISELDWYRYNFLRAEEISPEREEFHHLLQIGITRFIQLALKMRPSFDAPVVMFVRDVQRSVPILAMLRGLGMIEHGRRIAQSISAGIGNIEQIGESKFHIILPDKMIDDAYYEEAVAAHYRNESHKIYAQLFKRLFTNEIKGEVHDALSTLVYPWMEHFIGYGATPILDEYFFSIAYAELQLHDGYDSFSGSFKFGEVEYRTYLIALTFIVAIFIRHEQFAEVLVRKDDTVKLENVLTITSDTPGFLESMEEAVNHFGRHVHGFKTTNMEEVQKIFEVLSVSRRNLALLDNPGCAIPFLIQCSDQGFIRCLSGAQVDPVKFLLDSLRYHYPKDYDKNQQSREKSMQTALTRVLDEAIPNLLHRENIKVKIDDKILTDIDAVVIEESSGTVFLCQLKYQELFGSDLHAKSQRTARLREQVASWLSALDTWLESVDEATIRATLRLPKSVGNFKIRRVIISKHYAYPLKDVVSDSSTAYANWVQFFNAVELTKRDTSAQATLQAVFEKIIEMIAPAGPQEYEREPRSLWVIDDLAFTISQK